MTSHLKLLINKIVRPTAQSRGVALLAIAAALVVAGGATVFTVRTIQSERTIEQISETKKSTKKIEQAIALWVNMQGATTPVLPCPADPTDGANFGTATAITGTDCTTNRGIVPFETLRAANTGLTEEDAIDEYGNYYTYIVDETSVAMCTGTGDGNGRTGTLTDNGGGSTTVYALISHGENGAGAYNSSQTQNGAVPNTLEDDNCPITTGDCSNAVAGQFRSGPASEDSDSFFDDTVTRVLGTSFNVECFELFGDQLLAGEGTTNDRPAGSESSFEGNQASSNYNNASSGDRRDAVISNEDPDGTADNGDEFVQVYLRSGDSNPRSSCFWNEGAIDLENRTVRAYVEVSFDEDTTDSRRGALIMGFLRGDEPIASALCGGEDTLLGWEDGPSNTLPTEKFAVELDTEGADNSDAVYEPDLSDGAAVARNHIAMIATNIDHSGNNPDPATNPARDGPLCDTLDAASTSFSTQGDGDASTTEQTLANMEGCYPNAANWLESGTTTFHGFRVELHQHDGNNCDATNPENFIRVNGWAFENASCTGDCETLLSDYTDQNPNVSYCIPYESVFQTLRFGFTSAGPAIDTNLASEPRIRQFGINSDVTDTVTKDTASATSETRQLSSQNYADEAGLTCASGQDTPTNIIIDDDYQSSGSNQRNSVFRSYRGVLSCNSAGRMGVQGITSERRLDHVGVDTSLWEDLFRREAIEVEFPEEVTRYMVHLEDFDNPAESFAAAERSVILAYNQNTYVGRKDVTACSDGNGFAAIGSFNGTAFDRVLIIPEPADQTYTDSNGYADHWVDAVKGCGSDNACFPENLDETSAEGDVTGLVTNCYDADFDSFSVSGSVSSGTQTTQMPYTDVETAYGSNSNNGSLVKFGAYGMKAFTTSGQGIYTHDDATRGIGVTSSSGDNHLESDQSETLTFLFDQVYDHLRLNVSRFDETGQERLNVEFRRGSTLVGTANLESCVESGNEDNSSRIFDMDTVSLGAFDRVVLIPQPDGGSGDTDVFIREIRACASASGDCSLSANSLNDCTADDPIGYETVTVN